MAIRVIYVRFKGQIFGPVTIEKAAEFAKRGQITRQHEVSTDKINWKPANQVPELFPNRTDSTEAVSGSSTKGSVSQAKGSSEATRVDWYANIDGANQGPVNEDAVKQWIDANKVTRNTLIWCTGMANWVEAGVTQPHWFVGKPPDPIVHPNNSFSNRMLQDGAGVRSTDGPRTERVPTYMFSAIFSTLFCCLPLGIVSLVYASKVNSLLAKGDIQGARKASSYAKLWAQLGVWTLLGPALLIAIVLLVLQIFLPDVLKSVSNGSFN